MTSCGSSKKIDLTGGPLILILLQLFRPLLACELAGESDRSIYHPPRNTPGQLLPAGDGREA
jgi:hypothetical protein